MVGARHRTSEWALGLALLVASCSVAEAPEDTRVADAADTTTRPDAADTRVDAPDDGEVVDDTVRWTTVLGELPEALFDVWGSGPSDVWLVGAGGLAVRGGPDGWRQLDLRAVDATAQDLRGVFGADRDHVWLVGDGGRVLRWTRASGSAELIETGTDATLNGVWGASEETLWAVGGAPAGGSSGPIILRLSPGGAARAMLPAGLPEGAALLDVWGTGADDVWAVGEAGLILRWDGVSWTRVDIGSSVRFAGVAGADGEVVIVGGTVDAVVLERRPGATTFLNLSPAGATLDAVAVGDGGVAWAVGALGQRFLRPAPQAAWSDRTDVDGSSWHGVWIDTRGDVWVVGDGRLDRRGPPRADVPTGALVRVSGEVEVDEDVEVIDDVEDVEDTSEIGPETEVAPTDTVAEADGDDTPWPFAVGRLSPDNPPIFTPIADGETVTIVHGPQGGFHVELAVRFPWASTEPQLTVGLKLELWVLGTRQAVYDTLGYPFEAVGDGLYQTYVVTVMFECVFTGGCTSSEFDGLTGRLDVTVQPPGQSWSGSMNLLLDDSW